MQNFVSCSIQLFSICGNTLIMSRKTEMKKNQILTTPETRKFIKFEMCASSTVAQTISLKNVF